MSDTAENNPCTLEKADWSAVLNEQPPAQPRLHITGKVTCPTAGWKYTIRRATFPDLNPTFFGVDLEGESPRGSADVVSKVPVELTVEFTDDDVKQYKVVSVHFHQSLTIDIEVVS